MKVESFVIENESEADDYLKSLLWEPEYRSLSTINEHTGPRIKDDCIKQYFVRRGAEIMKNCDH